MSPDSIASIIPVMSALLASGVLVAEHYMPSRELSRTTNYVIGSLACLVPISAMLMALDALGTLTAVSALITIWTTYVTGGLVVFVCYWRDGQVAAGLKRKADAAQHGVESAQRYGR